MSSSYESDEEDQAKPYFCKDDPQFADLEPIPQDDGPNPVVQIMYSDCFKDNHDYFRAIYKKQEISHRAYFLTEHCINHNAANYTVWEYRRRLVRKLKLSCETELEFTKSKMGPNPKNYQMWHHRNSILDIKAEIGDGEGRVTQSDISRELRLTEKVFENDAKNYHAWQHRVYLFKKYRKFFSLESEMEYCKKLIGKDYRNNSVWNYIFTIHDDDVDKFTGAEHGGFGFDKFDYEWLFACVFVDNGKPLTSSENASANLDHANEASYNFLTAVFNRPETPQDWKRKVYDQISNLLTILKPVPFSIVVFLLETYESMEFSKSTVKNLVTELKTTDSIRENYWTFVEGCM